MKKSFSLLLAACATGLLFADYVPAPENLKARAAFDEMRFGIFIHWGFYSLFGQGEWYQENNAIPGWEYEKAANAFYPHAFDADDWVKEIKASGAKYITFTSRHHDSFSMWATQAGGDYCITNTPYGKDVLKSLAAACAKEGVQLNLYYSLMDWRRGDYPGGRCKGCNVYRKNIKPNYDTYRAFMKAQLGELLTNYGPIGAIWFDGEWDHTPRGEHAYDPKYGTLDWKYDDIYGHIHALQPACLIINNHHHAVAEGEDGQTFERDVPGENRSGYSDGQQVTVGVPLETCDTMTRGAWGYQVEKTLAWKTPAELIALLARTSSKGANLLLNIGPQPDGLLPWQSREILKAMGAWMKVNGESIYGTRAGSVRCGDQVVSTKKGDVTYLHLLEVPASPIYVGHDLATLVTLADGEAVGFRNLGEGWVAVDWPAVKDGDTVLKATFVPDGVIARFNGLVSEKTPGWVFQISDGWGFKFNPLEGWYPDKGGKLISPRITLPKPADGQAYYKLSFDARAKVRAYEAVAFYDAAGNMLADNYDVVYPGEKRHYERFVFAHEGVVTAEVFFQSAKGCEAWNVKLEKATAAETAAWCDKVYGEIEKAAPYRVGKPEGDLFKSAPKTLAALKSGKPVRILCLGDSIIQDLFHSQFHALWPRTFPKSDVKWLLSVRGATGCWFYRLDDNFKSYVLDKKPDCVILGGISNWKPVMKGYPVTGNAAFLEVCEKIRAAGIELIALAPGLSVDTRMKEWSREFTPLPKMAYDAAKEAEALALTIEKGTKLPSGLDKKGFDELKAECAKRGIGFADVFTPAYAWLYESGLPWSWYSRDYCHSGERGKQILARTLEAFFTAAK